MYPQTHFLTALFLGLILARLGVLGYYGALACGILAVLVDLDHWLVFVITKRKISFWKVWNAATIKHIDWERSFIHHRTGFIILSLIITIFWLFNPKISWILGVAYYSHMFLDYVHVSFKKKYQFKKIGLLFNMTGFELILDFVLILGIVFLLV